jgi:hypothetical protein
MGDWDPKFPKAGLGAVKWGLGLLIARTNCLQSNDNLIAIYVLGPPHFIGKMVARERQLNDN